MYICSQKATPLFINLAKMETQIFKTEAAATDFLLRNSNPNVSIYTGKYKKVSVMCNCGETECVESINDITEEMEVMGICFTCGED